MPAVVLSLAAAACFAASTMFIHRVPCEVGPLQLVCWQMGIALVLTAALALLFGMVLAVARSALISLST